MVWRVALHICLLSDFRKPFWRTAKHALRHGQIDGLLGAAFMSTLIHFTRRALRGDQNASYYSAKQPAPCTAMAATKPPTKEQGCGGYRHRSSPRVGPAFKNWIFAYAGMSG